MYSKLVIFIVTILLGVTLHVHAHAIITPALGVNGTGTRNDVQRPSNSSMCGSVNIAGTISNSTSIPLAGDNTFKANITNFNGGQDGSRQVTAAFDTTGTGTNFTSATVVQNGDLAPSSVGSQELIVQLPSGTICSGGPSKDLCLVSFKTAGGFGNCVVLQQATIGSASCKVGKQKRADSDQMQSKRDLIDSRATGTRAARVLRRAFHGGQ